MSELIYSVREIFDASEHRGCLQQYGCRAFSIPPYQRGYKWGSEVNQPVERLLSDLTQAWKRKAKEYLLQAITVKKVAGENGIRVLEVIDGQQRLTTLFILIHALKFQCTHSVLPNIAVEKLGYRIRHEDPTLDDLVISLITARNSQKSFGELKNEHHVDDEQRQDCYYLKCAVLRCVCELGKLGQDVASAPFFNR